MYADARSVLKAKKEGAQRAESLSRRILLVVGPEEIMPPALVDAVEREFPWISVEQVSQLQEAFCTFVHAIPLILVDCALLDQVDRSAPHLAKFHPGALIAIMHDRRRSLSAGEVFASTVVRGVLPMDLKLDVWLSVVRLMLRGGEYFPSELFNMPRGKASPFGGRPIAAHRPASGGASEWDELTEREVQIVEMVSRGMQNKIIAASLGLSEHTVKIHIHNIIRKLGAHNRTEVASIFHKRRDGI